METNWRYGQFVWREQMCPNVLKAKAFYGELCGWSFQEWPLGPHIYTVCQRDGKMLGGFLPADPNMGPPAWLSYISLRDLDAVIATAKAHGGKVPRPPTAWVASVSSTIPAAAMSGSSKARARARHRRCRAPASSAGRR
jgi:uncharacterized protein